MKNQIRLLVESILRWGGMNKVNKATHPVCLVQIDRGEQNEINRLEQELSELEYVLGESLVYLNKTGFKTRMTTLARRHLKTAGSKSEEKWVAEAKGYVRYCCRKNDRNATAVMAMLMPFDLRYREAQRECYGCIQDAVPTVG